MQSQGHVGRTASNGGNQYTKKSFLVFKQRKGMVRLVFGETTDGQDGSWPGEIGSRDKEDLN